MWTIIILLIVNFIIKKLFDINILKHLLFNPKINASITAGVCFFEIIKAVFTVANQGKIHFIIIVLLRSIPWLITILDCVQDIIWGEEYYGLVENHISPLYAVKSITSCLTVGLSRAVFFLFTSLYIPRAALRDVNQIFEGRRPTDVDPQYPYNSSFVANFFDRFYSTKFLQFADPYITEAVLYVVENLENLFAEWKAVRYDRFNSLYGCPYTDDQFIRKYCEKAKPYRMEFEKIIRNNLEEGKLLTNKKCVDDEIQLRKENLEKFYPKKKIVKWAEKFTEEGKQALAERAEAERSLLAKESLYTYINANYYYDCGEKVSEAMSNRTILSACDIAELDEVVFLKDLEKKDSGCNGRWREYFIIFNMQWLVSEEIVNDENISNAILDRHQYGLVNGKAMVSRNANDIPGLALDDED